MTLFITQCPHCTTAFRTSISQLQSADGMVRCGACLKIFAADDHLLPSADLQTITHSYQELPSDQEEIDADMLSEPLFDPEPAPPDADPESRTEVFTLDLSDSVTGKVDPSISADDSLWELLEDPEPETVTHSDVHGLDQHSLMQETTAPKSTPIFTATPEATQQEHLSAENIAAVGEMAAALELEWPQPSPRRRHRVLLYTAALLLSLGLALQYIWHNIDTLSQDAATRIWLQRTCALLPCTLPPLIDMRAIRSDNLMVRSHTEIANALSVNLTFHNEARYPQPYPLLDLRFLNVNNELIATRQFTPEEYLGPAFSAQRLMPPSVPVQVALEILDPGSDALNYEVSFSPAAGYSERR